MWFNFFDKVYLLNLQKREDRLLESAKLFEEYQIPYEVFPAIEDREQGARGLRDSVLLIFNEAIKNNYENIFIFEDDIKFVEPPQTFHYTMNEAVKQLPENYHLIYGGGQPTAGYASIYSANLLPAIHYFATHAVGYSKQGIKEILAMGMDFPIDNWLVKEFQVFGRCFAVNPILCSQRAGFSDIGGNEINWDPFIVPRHNQKVAEIRWK